MGTVFHFPQQKAVISNKIHISNAPGYFQHLDLKLWSMADRGKDIQKSSQEPKDRCRLKLDRNSGYVSLF